MPLGLYLQLPFPDQIKGGPVYFLHHSLRYTPAEKKLGFAASHPFGYTDCP